MSHILRRGLPLSILFILVFSATALAGEKKVVKMQGVIMAFDLKKNVVIVNERLFVLNPNTTLHNDKGTATTIDKLKPNMWVYIEGLQDKMNRRIVAQKIYLLPKYIEDKEKHRYPFIQ